MSAGRCTLTSAGRRLSKDYEKWKIELADNLKESWLPLAGLFWLKPGQNTFGTDASNAIVFPKGPARAAYLNCRAKT